MAVKPSKSGPKEAHFNQAKATKSKAKPFPSNRPSQQHHNQQGTTNSNNASGPRQRPSKPPSSGLNDEPVVLLVSGKITTKPVSTPAKTKAVKSNKEGGTKTASLKDARPKDTGLNGEPRIFLKTPAPEKMPSSLPEKSRLAPKKPVRLASPKTRKPKTVRQSPNQILSQPEGKALKVNKAITYSVPSTQTAPPEKPIHANLADDRPKGLTENHEKKTPLPQPQKRVESAGVSATKKLSNTKISKTMPRSEAKARKTIYRHESVKREPSPVSTAVNEIKQNEDKPKSVLAQAIIRENIEAAEKQFSESSAQAGTESTSSEPIPSNREQTSVTKAKSVESHIIPAEQQVVKAAAHSHLRASYLSVRNISFSYPDEKRTLFSRTLFKNQRPSEILEATVDPNEELATGLKNNTHKNNLTGVFENLSFELVESDRLGVIGPNGVGKTSLLRLLSGALPPTEGEILNSGTIISTLNLQAGFHPNATGRENIYLKGLLYGYTVNQLNRIEAKIAARSGLKDSLNRPFRTYSAGMRARLSFAIVTSLNADILILDEWLNVGDQDFRRNAKKIMLDFLTKTPIVVLSSHDRRMINKICNKVLDLSEYRPKVRFLHKRP